MVIVIVKRLFYWSIWSL